VSRRKASDMGSIMDAIDAMQHGELAAAERRYVELLERDADNPAAAGELHAVMARLGKTVADARRDATTIGTYMRLADATDGDAMEAAQARVKAARLAVEGGAAELVRVMDDVKRRQRALVEEQTAADSALSDLNDKRRERFRMKEADAAILQHTTAHREGR
jgi:hypothetical protein